MALLLPWILYGVAHIPIGSASVHEWLPIGRPERDRYEKFLQDFGSDQFLLVSWDGCRLDDPRLRRFVEQCRIKKSESPKLIETVQSTQDLYEVLTQPPLQLNHQQAWLRLENWMIGEDGTAAVVIQFTPFGATHQKEAILHVRDVATHVLELEPQSLKMAGTIYEAYAVDEAAESSLRRLVVPSCIVGFLIAWVCLRSIHSALAVLLLAGVGQTLAIATVFYAGGQFSAVLVVLPTLVFMLTLSGAVHLMSYYGDVSAWHLDHRGSRATLLGLTPSILSTVTTAFGMGSLAVSQLEPVRTFGLYSAFALCVATFFLLMGFPATSDWFSHFKRQPGKKAEDKEQNEHTESLVHNQELAKTADNHSYSAPWSRSYTGWMQRYSGLVVCSGFLLIGISFYGLLFLKASTKFDDMFPSSSPTVENMNWLESHLGPISSIEVLLRFPVNCELDVYDRLVWVDRVCESIHQDPDFGAVIAATTFAPALPKSGSTSSVVRRSILRARLSSSLDELKEQGWVAESSAGQIWRITTKVSAVADEDLGELTKRVSRHVDQTLSTVGGPPPFAAEYTGLSPLMHVTQLALIRDLGASFTVAFITITPVMMLIARGFWAGLLIMIPNVLPETLVFGCMAWLGFHLDIAGLLTASVAMGIAVNDTLHFVNWYARRLSFGDTRQQAIADTLTSCAGAMFHTMLISCFSMLPFLLAEFNPTRQFAVLMIAMLSSALLGDLVLLPAMLLSPLGKCLIPRKKLNATRICTAGINIS